MKPILSVNRLQKYFSRNGRITKAIDNVTFDLHPGKVLGLIGESGSGKTTIGRALIRLIDNYGGLVLLEDMVISGDRVPRKTVQKMRQKMQMIFQDPMSSLNGQKNIASILSEPLVTNGWVKEQKNKYLRNRREINNYFGYTFLKNIIEAKVQVQSFHSYHLQSLKGYFQEILNSLITKDNWTEDELTALFKKAKTYLIETHSQINSNLDPLHKLLKLHAEKVSELERGVDLTADEVLLNNSKKELKFCLQQKKKSVNHQFLLDDLKRILADKKTAINRTSASQKSLKLLRIITRNIKKDLKLNLSNCDLTKNIDDFNVYAMLLISDGVLLRILKGHNHSVSLFKMNQLITYVEGAEIRIREVATKLLSSNTKFLSPRILKQKVHDSIFDDVIKNLVEPLVVLEKRFRDSQSAVENEFDPKIKDIEQKIEQEKKFSTGTATFIKNLWHAYLNFRKCRKSNRTEVKKFGTQWYTDHAELIKRQITNNIEIKNLIRENQMAFKLVLKEFSFNIKNNKLSSARNLNDFNKTLKDFHHLLMVSLKRKFSEVKTFGDYLDFGFTSPLTSRRFMQILVNLKVSEILEEVGMKTDHLSRYPHEFSGGQRQRIAIARALISEPKVVIADEPIASLDISIQAQIINLLKTLCEKKGISLIFISHDLSIVEYLADDIVILNAGRVLEKGNSKKIFTSPVHPYTKMLIESTPKISNHRHNFVSNVNNEFFISVKDQAAMKFHKVDEDHYVFGTETNLKTWRNEKPVRKQ